MISGRADVRSERCSSPKQRQQRRLAWLFVSPAAVLVVVFLALPFVDAILLSFRSWDGLHRPTWIGMRNYSALLKDQVFWLALRNTAIFTIALATFQTSIPLFVASLLNTMRRGSAIFHTLYFMPFIISGTITGLLWGMVLNSSFGVLNQLLRSMGMASMTHAWLADRATVIPSLIVVMLWQSLGFYVVIYLAGLRGIPREYYEAAALDGATTWHQFRFITVPMLRTLTTVVAVLNTIAAIQAFDQVWVMTQGGPNHASETLGTFLYKTAFSAGGDSKLGYAAAVALVILFLSLALSIIQIRVGWKVEPENR